MIEELSVSMRIPSITSDSNGKRSELTFNIVWRIIN